MIHSFLKKILGDPSDKKLKSYTKLLPEFHRIEAEMSEKYTTLESVQARIAELRAPDGRFDIRSEDFRTEVNAFLSEIRFEVFALHRIACRLISGKSFELSDGKSIVWNMIPYDVQIIGAISLVDGNISEMRTGEGKTLVATIAATLGAMAGFPVHIVTVNDYLAKRDAAEMGIIYGALGLSTGVITHDISPEAKRTEYLADVVYATNNELGFDYLRDNMVSSLERRVMGPLYFAIVDEVDSILVDEARTPLIISAPDSEPTTKYIKFAQIAKTLKNEIHYKIDEKQRTASLTEGGITELERILGIENIYLTEQYNDIHHIENALKANAVYERDVDYLVRWEDAMIIDEHTGRVLSGRRYSDGLHQAIEAKEGIKIQQESRTLASITFQNYFRLYKKLAGMTGTAKTEEEEFYKIYRLEVITIPTNRPLIRDDKSDLLFKNETGKYAYLVRLIRTLHEKGQPLLIGTVSVAKSELLSGLLTKEGIPHQVLNAKQDAKEAEIIAGAGKLGAITIATNMAGRGTDIKIDSTVATLSGEVEVGGAKYTLGGLYVIGTEKHETRRIDNQLRGRSGRQWDPGMSQFMVAPTDDIMRIFGGDKLFGVFNSPLFASLPDDEPLDESKMLTKRITGVQKQVEGRNFDVRKHILEYDDVLNQHRLVMYGRRNRILENTDIHGEILATLDRVSERLSQSVDLRDDTDGTGNAIGELVQSVNTLAGSQIFSEDQITDLEPEGLHHSILQALTSGLQSIETRISPEDFTHFEKSISLATIDEFWMNHIDKMAHLREEVAFEGYAQKQPLVIYKERAYEKFAELMTEIDYRVIRSLLSAQSFTPVAPVEIPEHLLVLERSPEPEVEIPTLDGSPIVSGGRWSDGIRVTRVSAEDTKKYAGTWRNELCPCGSGKKFKHCHGK